MDKEILEQLEIASRNNLSFAVNAGYATQLYNYINNLQQRIDKAIEYINSQMTTYEDDGDFGVDCCCDGLKLLSILQGEEVK